MHNSFIKGTTNIDREHDSHYDTVSPQHVAMHSPALLQISGDNTCNANTFVYNRELRIRLLIGQLKNFTKIHSVLKFSRLQHVRC
jgi:hypothetical protein